MPTLTPFAQPDPPRRRRRTTRDDVTAATGRSAVPRRRWLRLVTDTESAAPTSKPPTSRAPTSKALRRAAARCHDAGMATAEYAIATLAACGFAGLLVAILSGGQVRGLLLGIIRRALSAG